ncbi:Cmc1 protein [Saccharomycopsis crataegensis]|uniref:COX assembly mitochondrial protein n=1 Tax=Saccharomycopsis crataegensis TaxID=43959 RepID=A0AAV5QHC9_9ASCO|nr:Cmc1 protein [Saccharomycopsis crataegensis]
MSGKQLPLWALTPKEEKEAYANWKKSAYQHCDDDVKNFAACSKAAGISVTLKCRGLHNKMYACIESYQTKENLDLEYDKVIERKRQKKD